MHTLTLCSLLLFAAPPAKTTPPSCKQSIKNARKKASVKCRKFAAEYTNEVRAFYEKCARIVRRRRACHKALTKLDQVCNPYYKAKKACKDGASACNKALAPQKRACTNASRISGHTCKRHRNEPTILHFCHQPKRWPSTNRAGILLVVGAHPTEKAPWLRASCVKGTQKLSSFPENTPTAGDAQ